MIDVKQLAALPESDVKSIYKVTDSLLSGKPESEIAPDQLGFLMNRARAVGATHTDLFIAALEFQAVRSQIETLRA